MKRFGWRGMMAAAILLLSAVLTFIITQPAGSGVRLNAGEVSPATYKSPRTVTYKSDLKTQEAENRAADAVSIVYRADVSAGSQQDSKLSSNFTAIAAVRDAQAGPTDKAQRLQAIVPISAAEASQLVALSGDDWNQVQSIVRTVVGQLQTTALKPEDTQNADGLVTAKLPNNVPPPVRATAAALAGELLIPNTVVDQQATNEAKARAKSSVEPVSYTVERDQIIIGKGQVVTDVDVERLQAVGLTRPAFNWQRTLGVFLLVVLFSLLLLYQAPQYAKRVRHPRRLVGFLGICAAAVTVAGILVPSQPILAYVVPLAAPVLLLAIFYGFELALLSAISLSAFYALASGGSFELFFIQLAAATAVILFYRRISNAAGFLRAGALVAVVVFIGMTAFSLLSANFDPAGLPKFALASALNGALTATFVFAGTAFLGAPLGIVTFLQLLELENPRHPLLRKLATEAPGTYSHSLRMAGIVENVAERIHADSLLARVQTLYHDIGKTAHPEYYIENQHGNQNPHTDLLPRESANVLRTHIAEGLRLAAAHNLPEQVAQAIPEHHGTSLMEGFWVAAKKRGGRPKEADFRYLGPKPQSKETAVIMLADAVEATSRMLEKPDEKQIRAMVDRLTNARVADGQFDCAPLTTAELNAMKEALVAVLLSDLHKRISYPKEQSRA